MGTEISEILETAAIMIGFNTCLGRKEHRLSRLFLMIPFTEIINGLFVPVLLVPPSILQQHMTKTIREVAML